jgi:ribose transport system permease protein
MARTKKRGIKRSSRFKAIENVLLLALFLVGAYLMNNYLFSYPVVVSVLKGMALISVLAIAESIVLASGGIDFSIPSIGLLSASIIFYLVEKNITNVYIAVALGLIAGTAIGYLNGLFIAKIQIQPIIITMATSVFTYGISGAITNNIVLFDTCKEFAFFRSIPVFVIPTSLIIALVMMLGCFSLFKFTIIGRQVFAVGGSEGSAKLSGLNVDRIKIFSYCGAGFLAAIGGLMVLADSELAARFYGAGPEIEVIFAAIIGGVSLYSGAKMFFQVCIGACIIATVNRMIYGLFVFNYMQSIIIGLLFFIVIAVRKNIFKRQKTVK